MTKVEYRYQVWWNGEKWRWVVTRKSTVTGGWVDVEPSGKSSFRWLAIRRAKNVIVQAGLAAKEAKEKERLNVDKTVVIDV